MVTSVLDSLNHALHQAMDSDSRVFVIGEDILDPYGGAFKVTRGLSTKYPDRVLTTPISEAGIVGLASGMGMRGLHPVVEIMFGDFVTLIADQLINHAAKFCWMYNEKVRVPIVVRTPMGGRRGYGPTHSQSLEKHFLGVPGLKVVAPNTLGNPGDLLLAAIEDEDPVLFIEHKLLYPQHLLESGRDGLVDFTMETDIGPYPDLVLRPQFPARMTIATYGYNFELARAAATDLMMEYEIFSEIVVFSQLSPFNLGPLISSVERTGKLLTIEEGTLSLGWGAEILAQVAEKTTKVQARRVAAREFPIANAKSLEESILPSVQQIINTALLLTSN
jgi:pyruvate/2-oxoglutarate/acetoin dehydrogenase E1 component